MVLFHDYEWPIKDWSSLFFPLLIVVTVADVSVLEQKQKSFLFKNCFITQ